jgi:hypothetical protein
VAKKRRARQGRQEITFHIQAADGSATVTANPSPARLSKTKTNFIKFTSNDPQATIVFRDSSPIAEAEPGKSFKVGTATEFFKVVDGSKSHGFDCGFTNRLTRAFSIWGGAGGTIPPE